MNGSERWDRHELREIVGTYNSRPHSVTGVPPAALASDPLLLAFSEEGKEERAAQRKGTTRPRRLDKIVPGCLVVISRERGVFEKEASSRGTMTSECFRVRRVDSSHPIPLIHLEDMAGERILGGYVG